MERRDRQLYRDTSDQKIAGVCSGLGHYFDLDPLLVRVAFVSVLVFGGAPLVAYLLLWWLVDEAPPGYFDETDEPGADPGTIPPPTVPGADA